MPECVDPSAPEFPCCICGKPVKTCERRVAVEIPGGQDYTCPAHPHNCQLSNGDWTCSEACYDKAVYRAEHKYLGQYFMLMILYGVFTLVSLALLFFAFEMGSWIGLAFLACSIICLGGFVQVSRNYKLIHKNLLLDKAKRVN
jgi:hypothetical protein